ncbi:MAG: hypothetical protein HY867_17355 [Chloroflexi bacterium]|nr:hypothetical protein [Chloroflexota bacterium]
MFNKPLFILTLILLLSACATQPVPANTSPATELPSETPPHLSPTALPTETIMPRADGCPSETADLKLLVNVEEGYCLLYPADDVFVPLRFVVINTDRKTADTPGAAWVDIMVEPANGLTAAQVADAKIAEWGEGFNITREETLVDGVPAVVVDGLPGVDSVRVVFIVSNDRLYALHFMPWFPNPNEVTRLDELYKTVMDTMHFLP